MPVSQSLRGLGACLVSWYTPPKLPSSWLMSRVSGMLAEGGPGSPGPGVVRGVALSTATGPSQKLQRVFGLFSDPEGRVVRRELLPSAASIVPE